MKKAIIFVLLTMSMLFCRAQSDSVLYNVQDYNFLTAYTEANYAAYPSIIENGYADDYLKQKGEILDSIKTGVWGIKRATCEYAYWFNHHFDAHFYADLPLFWQVCKRRDTPDYAHLMEYNPQPVSKLIDKNSWLIRIPSCAGENPTNSWVADAVKSFLSSSCKNLILDIRGNSGGSDAIWEPFVSLMVDHKALHPETLFFRNTYTNRYHASMPDWMKEPLKNTKDDQPFVLWGDDEEEEDEDIPIHDAAIHMAIIIDRKTASSAETILRIARNYSDSIRVRIYGKENSAGCAYTGNILPFHLPNSRIQVYYPTTISSTFIQHKDKQNASGIAPDVKIDLAYPPQLTDNIDSWVLWIAKIMR